MYKTNYFSIKELVHPKILNAIGENNCWMRLDEGVLRDIDLIRELWNDSIYVNLGRHDSRGLRPPNDPDGSFYSVHKQGKAFDLVPSNGEYKEFWLFVCKLIENGILLSINTIEDFSFTPSWCHVASMNHNKKPLIIKP